jgi:hypothetical protein
VGSGYSGSLADYIGLCNYAKSVLVTDRTNASKAWPVSVKGFTARSTVGPTKDEITVSDTFQVNGNEKNSLAKAKSLSQSFVSKTFSIPSSESWLRSIHENIQREISK